MAHSFRFIYWKVCCYFCIRPKKRRKKQRQSFEMRPLVTFKPPVLRPCATTNLPPRQPLASNQSSTSTFYTAQAASGASSPSSSPIVRPPAKLPDYPVDNCYLPEKQNLGSIIPVIANRYVLQTGNDVPVRVKDDLAIFTISNNFDRNECENYTLPFPLKCNKSIGWENISQDAICGDYEDQDKSSRIDVQCRRPISDDDDDDQDVDVSVPMWLCMALVISYICGGAVLFTFWEKWNFLDSSYFCFVTLTTIGFGDLVPGSAVISDDNQLTLGLCSLYLLFGMALLAMSFNLVQEEVTRSVRRIGQRIGIISDDEDD